MSYQQKGSRESEVKAIMDGWHPEIPRISDAPHTWMTYNKDPEGNERRKERFYKSEALKWYKFINEENEISIGRNPIIFQSVDTKGLQPTVKRFKPVVVVKAQKKGGMWTYIDENTRFLESIGVHAQAREEDFTIGRKRFDEF